MKRLDRKKVWVPVIALCSVGLIVGTGYAAWTITKNGTGEGAGSFIADTVEEENIEVKNLTWYDENETTKSNGAICFGWDKAYTPNANDWLTNQTPDKKAKMVQVLKFDVISKNSTANVTVSNLELAETDTDKQNAYTKATDAGDNQRIVPPENLVATEGTASDKASDGTTTTPYSIKIEFAWGKKFDNSNPIKYYNGLASVDDTTRSNAKSDLETLAKLDGIQFKFTITAAKSGTASK